MIFFQPLWNECISADYPDREPKPRDYVYASELGGSMFDTYLKMTNTPQSHPPNARALRKFKMGNNLEKMVKEVYDVTGLLVEDERPVIREPSAGLVGIHGRMDFFLSYDGQRDRAKRPDGKDLTVWQLALINEINRQAPKEPRSWITELKSVSSMIFPAREIEAAPNHLLQAGFYSFEEGLPSVVTYISKDDGLMAEHYVSDIQGVNDKINAWVGTVTGFYDAKERPPMEELIVNENGRFKKNWRVEYSPFLEHYKFESPQHYRSLVEKPIARWNRILKRNEENKPLTDDNKLGMDEMRKYLEKGKLP